MAASPSSSGVNEVIAVANASAEQRPEQHGGGGGGEVRSHRACVKCRRKKTKCDMERPVCGLCRRTGSECTFPTKRKTPEWRRPSQTKEDPNVFKRRFERLVELLESKMSDKQDLDALTQTLGQPRSEGSPDSPESAMSIVTGSSANTCPPPTDDGPNETISPAPLRQRQLSRPPQSSPSSANPATPAGVSGSHSFERANPVAEIADPVSETQSMSLEVPLALASELVRLYFDMIQPWLSLLHRPRFYARYMSQDGQTLRSLQGYTVSEALLLHGMFALAARYSSRCELEATSPPDRGVRFITTAALIYEKARLTIEEPDLVYLQACILLAFERYTSGPCHRGWILSGTCVRIAYDLGLCDIDEDDETTGAENLDPEQWSRKEEMRRAWWHSWELDMFGSCMSRRPSMTDRRRMAVLLPVSDQAWYAGRPVASAVLRKDPNEAWKSLIGCPNQDARAWFIVANYLMTIPIDILQGGEPVPEAKCQVLANSIACFSLALPPHLRLSSPSFRFDDSCFAQSNWIIGIHIMMVSARAAVEALKCHPASKVDPGILQWKYGRREFSRIIYQWSPEYISVCQPFVACQLIPVSMRKVQSGDLAASSDHDPDTVSRSDQELLLLALMRHAEVWKLGSTLLYLRNILGDRNASPQADISVLAKHFAIYFPRGRRGTASSVTSSTSQIGGVNHQHHHPHQGDKVSPLSAQNRAPTPREDLFPLHNHPPPPQGLMSGPLPIDMPAFDASAAPFGMDRIAPFAGPITSQDDWTMDESSMVYDTEEALNFLRWDIEWPQPTEG